MTSATTQPVMGQRAERRGYGLVLFAAVMLVIVGCFNLIFIPAYPLWSLIIIAADIVALYALRAYGSRANLEAA